MNITARKVIDSDVYMISDVPFGDDFITVIFHSSNLHDWQQQKIVDGAAELFVNELDFNAKVEGGYFDE